MEPKITKKSTEPPPPEHPLPAADEAEITRLLDAWSGGEAEALERLIPVVVGELRRMAGAFLARGAPGHTLQPTALVNEVYLRLAGRRSVRYEHRTHFFATMAKVMRRILVDHARRQQTLKRGGDVTVLSFAEQRDPPAHPGGGGAAADEVDLLALDEALEGLAAIDPRQSRIVELRYFGGLTVEETAQTLAISPRTVKREWRTARLWLLRALGSG